jgi:hypothetical protein
VKEFETLMLRGHSRESGARFRRQMADGHGETGAVGEILQL